MEPAGQQNPIVTDKACFVQRQIPRNRIIAAINTNFGWFRRTPTINRRQGSGATLADSRHTLSRRECGDANSTSTHAASFHPYNDRNPQMSTWHHRKTTVV